MAETDNFDKHRDDIDGITPYGAACRMGWFGPRENHDLLPHGEAIQLAEAVLMEIGEHHGLGVPASVGQPACAEVPEERQHFIRLKILAKGGQGGQELVDFLNANGWEVTFMIES